MFSANSSTPHNRETNKKLVKIIHLLLDSDQSTSFRKPVPHKALGLGDYKKIVKKPIDLNQIRRQNNQSKYKFVEEALDDIQLCWDNCKLYNHASSEVYQQALILQKSFWRAVEEGFPQIYEAVKYNLKEQEINYSVLNPIHVSEQSSMHNQQESSGEEQNSQKNRNKNVSKINGENQSMINEGIDNIDEKSQISRKSEPRETEKQPIEVYLKQKPTLENISRLSSFMELIEDRSLLEQVLEVLVTYERENIVPGPKGEMNFRIEQIHLSTFHRICKIVNFQTEEPFEIIE